MARIINFQGRTIQVPDNATDDQVRQILQSQPAPQQSDVVSDALADASARSQFPDYQPEQPAEPSLIDHIMGGANYVGKTAAIAGDRFGEGMANLAGLPVDAANLAIELGFRGADAVIPGDQSWLKTSSNPLGGSDNLNDIRTLNGATGYVAPEPEDWVQTIIGRMSEELGASVLPVGGLAVAGGRMGAKAARDSGNALVRTFVAPAAANPAKFIGSEVTGASAAGLGAGIANLFADRETVGGQVADMLGALGGAGLAGVSGVVGRGIGQTFNALRQNPKYIDQVVKDAVVDRIARASGLDGTDGPIDTDQLIDMISGGNTTRPSDIIPGFQESLADATGNPGLAALEYSRQSGPNAGMFTTRRGANNEAVDRVMEAIAPQQTPGAFRSELETQRDLRLAAAADRTGAAQSEFDQYIQNLQPRMMAEERGATIRDGLVNAERAARELESMAWTGIDGQVDPAPLAEMLDNTIDGLSVARQQRISDLDQTVDIPRQLAGGDAPDAALEPRSEAEAAWQRLTGGSGALPEAEPTTTGIQELLDMRSVLLEEQRNALSGPQPDRNRASAIGQLVDDVNAYLESDAIDPSVRQQIEDARAVSLDVNEQYNRPNDPISATLATSQGRPDLPDSAVGPRFVQPDNKQASNIDRLLATTDLTSHGGSVREAVKDEILSGIQKHGTDPDKLEQYLGQFTRAFDRFPDLRDEVTATVQSGRALDEAGTAQADLIKNLGDGTQPGRGTVGRYLQYSDANSEKAISEVLAAKDPGAAADELLTFIGDNPSAVEGARAAFWQKLKTESQSADNSQRSMGGTRAWRGDWLKSFLDKPATAAVAERLYRDNPDHLANIRAYADILDNVDLRQRGKAVGTSGTAQGVNPVLTPETLQSRFYAYMRGQVSGTYLATSIAAVVARRAVRNAQTDAIERLTDQVLLNPDLAVDLLKENNPANRAALARKVRTWLGNEASTFVNLMDQEDEETDSPGSRPLRVVVEADEDNIIDAVTR